MTDKEKLPFTVDLWAKDELSIERDIADVADLSVARMAFTGAAVAYPERLVALRGPGTYEEHGAAYSREPPPRGRGWTTDPARLDPMGG